MSEISHALSSGVPYDICRLYNVRDSGATLRIAQDIAPKLASVADSLQLIPAGVKVDSLSFQPSFFDFELKETLIEYPEEE